MFLIKLNKTFYFENTSILTCEFFVIILLNFLVKTLTKTHVSNLINFQAIRRISINIISTCILYPDRK